MARHRAEVVEGIAKLERTQDELLDRLLVETRARDSVVIAEDEAIIRLDLKETLQEEGYEVVGGDGRGDEAVQLVRDLEPDLAILDIKMPGLDGLAAAREISADRRSAVLILTAFSQRDLIEQARDAGALAYLVKPFQRSELIPAVEVALGPVPRDAGPVRPELEPRGAAGDPQGGRPGQGPAHGRARAERGRGVLLDPEAGDARPQDDAGRGRRGHLRRDLARGVGSVPCRARSCSSTATRSSTGRSSPCPTDLATASGQVTNAVFGFTSMLVNLLRDHKPSAIAVAFDLPQPTFRHERVDTYKANRESAPDILRQQMGLTRQVVESLHIPIYEVPGFEADDIIATLATQGRDRGDDVIIVTGDRDTYQLVEDPHVKVLYNKRGVSEYALYDEAGIAERTGVTPALYPQYAALRGDPSDNLPGVPGVGEKTAAKLIVTYGGIDGIFEHLDEQTPKLRENLAAHEATVRQNAEVMVLVRDVPIEQGIDVLSFDPAAIDIPEVRRLFEFLEFNTLFDRLAEALDTDLGPASAEATVLEAEVQATDGRRERGRRHRRAGNGQRAARAGRLVGRHRGPLPAGGPGPRRRRVLG